MASKKKVNFQSYPFVLPPCCPGEDEPYEVENRPEAEGGSEHLCHADHLQRGGHEVSHSSCLHSVYSGLNPNQFGLSQYKRTWFNFHGSTVWFARQCHVIIIRYIQHTEHFLIVSIFHHLTNSGVSSFFCSNIQEMRKIHKDAFLKKHNVKLGFMSAFVKAAAYALTDQPAVNAGKTTYFHLTLTLIFYFKWSSLKSKRSFTPLPCQCSLIFTLSRMLSMINVYLFHQTLFLKCVFSYWWYN